MKGKDNAVSAIWGISTTTTTTTSSTFHLPIVFPLDSRISYVFAAA